MPRLSVRSLVTRSKRKESSRTKSKTFNDNSPATAEPLPRPATATGVPEPAKHRSFLSRLFSRRTHAKRPSEVADLRRSPIPNDSRQTAGPSPRPISTRKAGSPEIEPILGFLTNQANRPYHAEYLLKLDDLNTNGQPCEKRYWIEYYAQLTGTVLFLWEADALDKALKTKDPVVPSMINIADASMKMVERLDVPDSKPLENTLSLSTAAQNRFLLHFKNHESLVQWTAAICLAVFENTLLQESYTGSLFAGKGRTINNLTDFLRPTRFVHESWARVRFRPGTPWRRCWCVITPANPKETFRLQKAARKFNPAHEGGAALPIARGNVSFYEKPEKKGVVPLARITEAWAAFAVYPQGFQHIEYSTLLKVEGMIHVSTPDSAGKEKIKIISCEGSVFVLPEPRPPIAGFEVLLRWLLPVYDTFGLYGRPTRLLAETDNRQSLMFALPLNKRAAAFARNSSDQSTKHSFAKHSVKCYLTVSDVADLIKTPDSNDWSECTFRQKLKELVSKQNDGHWGNLGIDKARPAVENPNEFEQSHLMPPGSRRPASSSNINSRSLLSPAPQISPIKLSPILGSPLLEDGAFPDTPSRQDRAGTSQSEREYVNTSDGRRRTGSTTDVANPGIQSPSSQAPLITLFGLDTRSDNLDPKSTFESSLPPAAPLAAVSTPPEICRDVTNTYIDISEDSLQVKRLSPATMSLIKSNAGKDSLISFPDTRANWEDVAQQANIPSAAPSSAVTTWAANDSSGLPSSNPGQNHSSQSSVRITVRETEGGRGSGVSNLTASSQGEFAPLSINQSKSFFELMNNNEETNSHTSPGQESKSNVFSDMASEGSQQPFESDIRVRIPQVLRNASVDSLAKDSNTYFLGSFSRVRSLPNFFEHNASAGSESDIPFRSNTRHDIANAEREDDAELAQKLPRAFTCTEGRYDIVHDSVLPGNRHDPERTTLVNTAINADEARHRREDNYSSPEATEISVMGDYVVND